MDIRGGRLYGAIWRDLAECRAIISYDRYSTIIRVILGDLYLVYGM